MVLDIRHIREESAPAVPVSPPGPDLGELLQAAASSRPIEQIGRAHV